MRIGKAGEVKKIPAREDEMLPEADPQAKMEADYLKEMQRQFPGEAAEEEGESSDQEILRQMIREELMAALGTSEEKPVKRALRGGGASPSLGAEAKVKEV